MKKPILTSALVSTCLLSFAQSPFGPQLAIPVYCNGIAQAVSNAYQQPPAASLSGMALMFLDTVSTADELIVTGSSELVIWHDYVGKSTKVTFIVPDSQMMGRLELIYFNSKCTATIWRQDRNTNEVARASGHLATGDNGYSLHFSVDDKTRGRFDDVFHRLNVFLMQLHTREMRRVPVKPWFNLDSLNVIVGSDSQFNTDNELFWFDQSLRNRLNTVAINGFSKLYLFKNKAGHLQDSIAGKRKVAHDAVPFDGSAQGLGAQGLGIRGQVSVTLQPDQSARYLFLKPDQTYRLFVDYSFVRGVSGPGQLSIQRFGMKNLDNGDFVELEIFDLTNSGFPVMYVDLIRGVVTADGGNWDISNVIHAIEDVFGASRLPYE